MWVNVCPKCDGQVVTEEEWEVWSKVFVVMEFKPSRKFKPRPHVVLK